MHSGSPPIGRLTRVAATNWALAMSLLLAGCGSVAPTTARPTPASSAAPPSTITTPHQTSTTADTAPSSSTSSSEKAPVNPIPGTTVRFASSAGSVDVTIDKDTQATRDLLSMLPLTLEFEDFAGREKIAYPPRPIRFAGSPPSSVGSGDLAIYTPWGNLAFFYEGERGAPSAQIARLGTFNATRAELEVLEEGPVTVDVV